MKAWLMLIQRRLTISYIYFRCFSYKQRFCFFTTKSAVMITQWENEWISLSSRSPGFNSQLRRYFKGFFPGWSHSANSSWTSVANTAQSPLNGTTQPVAGRPSPTLDRWWQKENHQAYNIQAKLELSLHISNLQSPELTFFPATIFAVSYRLLKGSFVKRRLLENSWT